jgi:hypothetical protein
MESGGAKGEVFERQAPTLPLYSVHGTKKVSTEDCSRALD